MNLKLASMLTAACVGIAAVGGAKAGEPMQPSTTAEVVLSRSSKDFFESAASANMFEIQASKLAQTKSSDTAIQSFAGKMISDHTEASTKLEALAESKHETLPTTLLKRHQMMLDSLTKHAAGADFDKAYKSDMIASHKEAVSLFDKNAKKAKDPEIKSFAAMMLPKLQAHGGMAHALM